MIPMPSRRSKRDKRPGTLRVHFAENVKAFRDIKFKDATSDTAKNRLLAKAADCSPSQIQRILKSELGTGIDEIERIALALDAKPADLITPYFSARFSEPVDIRTRRRKA